ncbi:Lrp/AsnC family transcriptional regulator [Deinococcus misasensis]|uniref:Lrp/AsnC family transcriptional regulator n=1 Tax=Deinococcus misasensis TaxID=392413 RepID=UPI0005550E88|nr:Lrp/AsnC family transcriptional regulator [Deinococcus misasensis]
MQENNKLDAVDLKILQALTENARMTFTDLSKRIGLSLPATIERVRRLEDSGCIEGYSVKINPKFLGLNLQALIRFRSNNERWQKVTEILKDYPEVMECMVVTGSDSHMIKVAVSSAEHLEKLLSALSMYGMVNTSMILSSPIDRPVLAVAPKRP